MLRPTVIVALISAALFVTFASGGCSHRDPLNLPPPPEGGAPTFTSVDASVAEPDASRIEYVSGAVRDLSGIDVSLRRESDGRSAELRRLRHLVLRQWLRELQVRVPFGEMRAELPRGLCRLQRHPR